MVIYIESVFAFNVLVDYLLLFGAARVAGRTVARRRLLPGFSPHHVGDADKGDILFLEREYPPYTPKRKDEGPSPSTPHIGSFYLEELHALRNQVRCTWLRHESSASRYRLQPRLTIVRLRRIAKCVLTKYDVIHIMS